MKERIINIEKIFSVSLDITSNAYKTLLIFDKFGLLNSKLLELNKSLWGCIERVCADDYFNTLFCLAAAVPEEFDFMSCLAFEGFSPWGDIKENLLKHYGLKIHRFNED